MSCQTAATDLLLGALPFANWSLANNFVTISLQSCRSLSDAWYLFRRSVSEKKRRAVSKQPTFTPQAEIYKTTPPSPRYINLRLIMY